MTNIREQAALSAAGKALADNVEEGDKLSKVWSQDIIDEANYTLRQRGLKIIVHTDRFVFLGPGWEVIDELSAVEL